MFTDTIILSSIQVLSDSKSGFDDTDADPNTEYLNVRIEVGKQIEQFVGCILTVV